MKKYLIITLLSFGLSDQLFAENINLLCRYIENSEVIKAPKYTQSNFRSDTVLIELDLKKQTIRFDGDSWPYLALSSGEIIQFWTKFNNFENQTPQDVSEVMKHWDEGAINRMTGVLSVSNFSEQNEGELDFVNATFKQYQCDKYEFKF